MRLRHLLIKNDGGVWGEDPTGLSDTIVLRSTEQTVQGGWNIEDPALRHITTSEVAEKRLRYGDLLVTKSSGSSDHIGKASFVTNEVADLRPVFSNFNQRLRPAETRSSRYLWYLLNSAIARYHYVKYATSTSGLGNLNGTILGNIHIPITDLATQKAIAAFLDAETARIDRIIDTAGGQAAARAATPGTFLALLLEKRSALITAVVSGQIDPAKWRSRGEGDRIEGEVA